MPNSNANTQVAVPQPPKPNPFPKDIKTWLEMQIAIAADDESIKKLAAMVHAMKNPFLGIQEIMALVMKRQGDQINGFAAVDNLDSDLRSEVSVGQGGFNSIGNNKNVDSGTTNFINAINQMQNFIDQQKNSDNPIIDKADLNNLQGAVDEVKAQFGQDWPDPTKIAADVQQWVKDSTSGKYSPELKNVQNAFQTLNQSTSALSTTTNTNLQFNTEKFKQFMGIYKSINQSWLKLTQATVTNQRSM